MFLAFCNFCLLFLLKIFVSSRLDGTGDSEGLTNAQPNELVDVKRPGTQRVRSATVRSVLWSAVVKAG